MVRFAVAANTRLRHELTSYGSESRPMQTALNIAMIIISVVLIALILLQTKGSSFSGAFGGDTGSIYRTRRGVEKTLFQLTIGVAILFVVLAIISSLWL